MTNMDDSSLLEKSGDLLTNLSESVVSLTTDSEILEKVPFASYIVKAFSLKEEFHLWRLERNCKAFMSALREGDTSGLSRLPERRRMIQSTDGSLKIRPCRS